MDTQGTVLPLNTFFRDARMKGGMGRLAQPEAAALLAQFFARYSTEGCNADQLLALADLAQRARDHDVARDVLGRAAQLPGRAHLAYYKLGRLELLAGDPARAAERFGWGTEADPTFPHNWMGRARALTALGKRADAVPAAERFVGFEARPHAADDLAVLTELADYLFEAGERQRSGPIYAFVRSLGASNPRTAVRQAESLIAAGAVDEALAVLRPLQAQDKLDLWGRRALAHCESQAGHHAEAVALAEGVLVERPLDAGFAATYLDVLVRARMPERWRDALVRQGGLLSASARAELAARLHLSDGLVTDAAAVLAGVELQRQTRLFYTAIETAYAALGAGQADLAQTLAERLADIAPDVSAPWLLQADIHLRQQQWERAAASLRAIPAGETQLPHVVLKWFEYHCFVGEMQMAWTLLRQLEETGLPSRQFNLPILRFFAERQDWAALAERALAWLGADFEYAQIGYVLYRAALRTGRQADFLATIEAIEGWRERPDLLRLHTSLAWSGAATLAEMEVVAGHSAADASPVMRHRMQVQRRLAARAAAPEGRRALFLCTNANYLCATMVALHSALSHSAPGREDCFLVVDDEVAELAGRLASPFRERGFAVSVVPASEVVGNAEKLYPAYGLFTSGHVLASAAYYRIYFARMLQRLGIYSRGLYIDSDVLVRRKLDDLFVTWLDGHPLAARVETPRPEVTRAIALHGLRDDLYFNSGVLLLDLTHPELELALNGAVAAISDDGVTLLFHDQCALNLGFRERFSRMELRWNAPVGEATRPEDLPAETAILHFLDRPKPWSAAYDGACATLWFDAWSEAAELIGEAAALEAFALSQD